MKNASSSFFTFSRDSGSLPSQVIFKAWLLPFDILQAVLSHLVTKNNTTTLSEDKCWNQNSFVVLVWKLLGRIFMGTKLRQLFKRVREEGGRATLTFKSPSSFLLTFSTSARAFFSLSQWSVVYNTKNNNAYEVRSNKQKKKCIHKIINNNKLEILLSIKWTRTSSICCSSLDLTLFRWLTLSSSSCSWSSSSYKSETV